MALVTDKPRSASVRALEDSTVLRLSKESIFAQPRVAVCVMKCMFTLVSEELRLRNAEVLRLDTSRRDKFEASTRQQIRSKTKVKFDEWDDFSL